MARKSIKGLFVAVELDLTKLKEGVKTAVTTLTTEFEKAKDSIDQSLKLDSGAFEDILTDVSKSINRVQNAIRSKTASGAFSDFIKENDKFKKSLESVATQAGVSSEIIKDSLAKAAKANQIKETVSAVRALGYSLNLSGEQLLQYAKSLGVTGEALEKLASHTDRLNAKSHGFLTSITNLMTGGNAMAALQSSLATLGANISIAGFTELGKSMMDTSIKVDSLRTAFTSIYKDADRAAVQLEYIRSVTDELGLEFYSTAEAAKGFFAAAETSTIKGSAEDIFRAFSSASSALKMTQEQTNGVFLAISQMMSKGKISAEEMRQQLAERLPGAVQLLADSMGVTLKQLDKMFESGEVGVENLIKFAEKVEEVYGESGRAASKALLGEMNKLKSAWTDFKAEFIRTDIVTDIIKGLQESVAFLKENTDVLRDAVNSLVAAFLAFSAIKITQNLLGAGAGFLRLTKSIKDFTKGVVTLRATLTALSTSLSMVTLGLSAIVGIGAFVWQSFREDTDKAKYSIEDFKKGIDTTASSLEGVGSEAKKASEELRRLATIRAEENLKKSQEELKKVEASFKNASAAIVDIYAKAKEGVKQISMSFGQTGKQKFVLFDDSELGKTLDTVTEGLDYFDQELKENRISASYVTKEFKNWQEQAKALGPQGEQLYSVLVGLEKAYLEAIVNSNNALANRNAILAEGKVIPENLETTSLTSSKYALNTIKKQAKDRGDFELVETINVAMSGDLENSKTGEVSKKSARELLELIRGLKVERKDYAYALQLELGLSQEIIESIKEQARLSEKKVNAPDTKKLEKYSAELGTIRKRYDEMTAASEESATTAGGKLKIISDWATKAKGEINETYNSYVKLDKKAAEEYKQKAYALVDLQAMDKAEKALQQYVEKGKSAYAEFEAAQTGAHKIEILESDYSKALEGLDKYLEKMLEKYKNNAEMRKLIEEDVEKYKAALKVKFDKDSLNASTDWKSGIKRGAEKLFDDASNYAKHWEDITVKGFSGMADALADFCTKADSSWNSLGDAFSDLTRSIINDIIKMQMQAASSSIAKGLFGEAGQAGLIQQGISWIGSFFADGGVVNSGLSSYSNGVYNTPTFFTTNGGGFQRYANGGVFGEAGPEAIMPLTRMPNGRLGVAATGGGGGGDVQVNVYNNSNSKAEVRQSTSSGGGKTIDVLIGDVVAKQMSTPGSKLNRTVSTYTGGQQAVTRR